MDHHWAEEREAFLALATFYVQQHPLAACLVHKLVDRRQISRGWLVGRLLNKNATETRGGATRSPPADLETPCAHRVVCGLGLKSG